MDNQSLNNQPPEIIGEASPAMQQPVAQVVEQQVQAANTIIHSDNAGQTTPVTQNVQPQQSQTDVLGIISLVLFFTGFAPIGMIIAIIGLKKAKQLGYSKTLSLIGLIINGIATIATILIIVLIAFISYGNVSKKAQDADATAYANSVASDMEASYETAREYPKDCSGVESIIAGRHSLEGAPVQQLRCASDDPTKDSGTYGYTSLGGQSFTIKYWSSANSSLATIQSAN